MRIIKFATSFFVLIMIGPVVKSGLMVVEYVPWFGSAALMLSNELHYKVQKELM